MIQQVPAYRVGELVFPTIQEAQKAELEKLFPLMDPQDERGLSVKDTVSIIVNHTDEIVAILTCQPAPKAKRKPRCDIGKKRAAKDTTGLCGLVGASTSTVL